MKKQVFAAAVFFIFSIAGTVYSQKTGNDSACECARRGARASKFTDWKAPVNLGPVINSTANDDAPALSRDGRSLYFTSTRLGGFGGEDIWVSRRTSRNEDWGTPVNLGATVNSGANERLRYLSPNGHFLLFQSDRLGGYGGSDIWASARRGVNEDVVWDPPVNLGQVINTSANELGAAFITTDQAVNDLFVFASGRPGGLGSSDFYASQIMSDGSLGQPVNVVELNSAFQDSCLTFSNDGLEVIFTSTRPDPANAANSNNLWFSTRASTLDSWSSPVNLRVVNTAGFLNAHPSLSFDGKTLIFTSNRPGGFGGLDLYITTRERRAGKE
jgi:Tol biopolymer transport system component